MAQSYTKSYLKIYIWQILGVILNFLSLFIVIPKISTNPTIYGVYSLCLSFVIFLSYADLGFLSAGYKYASEYFAKNQINEEVGITAFSGFILSIFTIVFSVTILIFAVYPNIIFKDISVQGFLIARKLLLILSFSAFFIVAQRIMQLIYGIRLKDYILQQINVIGNIIKLLSVFLFFPNAQEGNIVGYFFFVQCISISVTIIAGYLAIKYFNYPFKMFVKNFKYNTLVFEQTKSLALGSLLLSFSWILYYELDLLVIAKLLGAASAATYNIGLTILSLFRSIYAIIFNPFNARFNHLKGLNDHESLKNMILSVVRLALPFFVFPIFIISLLSEHLIRTWLGEQYNLSIPIIQLLIFCNILGFISNPMGILIMALEKTKLIYQLSWLMPVFYWAIIFFLYHNWGLQIFPMAKLAVFSFMGIVYTRHLFDFVGKNSFLLLLKDLSKISIIVLLVAYIINNSHFLLPMTKNTVNFCLTLVYAAILISFGFITYFIYNSSYRTVALNVINTLKQ